MSFAGGTIHEGALILRGCMWSLMDLYALGFLCTPYWICCFSGGGSILSLFKLISQFCSCGALILSNLPAVFLSHWYINSYMNKTAHQQEAKTRLPKRFMLVKTNCIWIVKELNQPNSEKILGKLKEIKVHQCL